MKSEFAQIFGYAPRPIQEETARQLLDGKFTVLRAPTGFGKTAAAQFPYFLARQGNLDFPRQMIYTLPLRVLANSLHEDAKKRAQKFHGAPCDIRLQTGEFSDDPLFMGQLTFATYDQLLSGFLHIPFSAADNLIAGAAVSSYLAFDEVHLMGLRRALGTTVAMIRWLGSVTPTLLMTATLTDGVLEWLATEGKAEIVKLSDKEIEDLPKPRTWEHLHKTLNAASIRERHNNNRTIVVANTVESAQRIYEELSALMPKDTRIILLHSRFFQSDRKFKEAELLELFKEGSNRSAILVATQVIEVGLNISCDNLHTEIAPANSLIQRAGRCARFENEKGFVWIYDLPDASTLPYGKEEINLTEKAESALWQLNAPSGYGDELQWSEDVHGKQDKEEISRLQGRKDRIFDVIKKSEHSAYSELVRDIDTVSVILTPKPDDLRQPWDLEGLSIRPSTIVKQWKAADDKSNFCDEDDSRWFVKKPQLIPTDKDNAERHLPPKWDWFPVISDKEIFNAPLLALNPHFVSYSSDLGLQFKATGELSLSPPIVRKEKEKFSYVRETYFEHITQVWKACQRHFINPERLSYAGKRLEQRCGLQEGEFQELLCLVVALHDVGKLSREWQKAIRGYQKERWGENPTDFLAHSRFNPRDPQDREVEKKYKRPPHAAEGAMMCKGVFEARFPEDVCYAAFSAIAQHHSAHISRVSSQELEAEALKDIQLAAQACGVKSADWQQVEDDCVRDDALDTSDFILQPDDSPDAYLLYVLLVRALRISDQFSFQEA